MQITSIHQCCGSPLKPEIPTRRVCNVVWSGVRLAALLADCEPDPAAQFVWSSGADYGVFEGDDCDAFVKDLPLDRVAADVLIAFEMNGSPLRPENGYPVRLGPISPIASMTARIHAGSERFSSRVQHIGSHPHSPGCCVRRPFIFTRLRTSQMSILNPSRLTVLMMQFWTYFWRFRQCQLNFMPFASALHAAVAFSRATLSALDIFAASAGVAMNAMPLTSTVAIMLENEAVAK
jgi:Oxidoreductase molybdopterin binding domain